MAKPQLIIALQETLKIAENTNHNQAQIVLNALLGSIIAGGYATQILATEVQKVVNEQLLPLIEADKVQKNIKKN